MAERARRVMQPRRLAFVTALVAGLAPVSSVADSAALARTIREEMMFVWPNMQAFIILSGCDLRIWHGSDRDEFGLRHDRMNLGDYVMTPKAWLVDGQPMQEGDLLFIQMTYGLPMKPDVRAQAEANYDRVLAEIDAIYADDGLAPDDLAQNMKALLAAAKTGTYGLAIQENYQSFSGPDGVFEFVPLPNDQALFFTMRQSVGDGFFPDLVDYVKDTCP